jgi:hypothetical protein
MRSISSLLWIMIEVALEQVFPCFRATTEKGNPAKLNDVAVGSSKPELIGSVFAPHHLFPEVLISDLF